MYAQVGVSLPHYTGAQWNAGVPVSRGDLEPGDLVFFDGLGHVGIYIGGDEFIHAPHTGDVVKISRARRSLVRGDYDGARRITRAEPLRCFPHAWTACGTLRRASACVFSRCA